MVTSTGMWDTISATVHKATSSTDVITENASCLHYKDSKYLLRVNLQDK